MTIDPLALGATLYMPATRADLYRWTSSARGQRVRSMVICLEDAVRDEAVPEALAAVAQLLRRLVACPLGPDAPILFLRPRDAAMLHTLLALPGIGAVAGFVLPKVTAATLPRYLAAPLLPHHRVMPTLESRELCDPWELRRLRGALLAAGERVLLLRIGGNDLLQLLGARRSPVRTAYDGPLGTVIASLVAGFAPWGFALSAPVFEHHRLPHLLAEEVARDVEHGLLTKSAIHPWQVAVIEAGYRVSTGELGEAGAILADRAPAVFAGSSGMCEPRTHRRWAEQVMRRAQVYGVCEEPLNRCRA